MSENQTEPSASVTVRFVEDTRSGKCWFEEKLGNDQWVIMPETKTACEGNSRSRLADVIESRRQRRLMIFRNIGVEEVIPIL